jgi:hypothetical protein
VTVLVAVVDDQRVVLPHRARDPCSAFAFNATE